MAFGTHAKVFIAVVEQGNIQEAAPFSKSPNPLSLIT